MWLSVEPLADLGGPSYPQAITPLIYQTEEPETGPIVAFGSVKVAFPTVATRSESMLDLFLFLAVGLPSYGLM